MFLGIRSFGFPAFLPTSLDLNIVSDNRNTVVKRASSPKENRQKIDESLFAID